MKILMNRGNTSFKVTCDRVGQEAEIKLPLWVGLCPFILPTPIPPEEKICSSLNS